MSDLEDRLPEMPMVHAGMFTQPGYLHISGNLVHRVPDWKFELWKDSIAWHAVRNGMEISLSSPDAHNVYEITWGKKP